ncbi:MAG: sulfite exporter TauE/SafE family protein [Burkholderiales bacterium]|nr:sulfite exporter TauE/SafE family protein [Burkholderiales bacterium]MBH2017280.1 sulfite exporter TauE/SafE family protein [Burkholderiales bacterium]
MLSGLLLTAFLMGLGGMAHCAAMCGAACAVAFPRGVSPWALLGRAIGYAMLGALAALATGLLSQWGRQVAMLKPLWMMAQAAVVILGVALLLQGQVPSWLDQLGRPLYDRLRQRWGAARGSVPAWGQPLLPLVAGMAWALLPCGLLYAALMVAALAPDPAAGALVMFAFALPSAVGVWAAPALLRWLRVRGQPAGVALAGAAASAPVIWMRQEVAVPANGAPLEAAHDAGAMAPSDPAPASVGDGASARDNWLDPRWAVRLSGLCLAGMAGWGLAHNLWAQWQVWCA